MSMVYLRQIRPLCVLPENGLNIQVMPGNYEFNGQRRYFRGTTVNLSSYVPSEGSRLVLIYLDPYWCQVEIEPAPASTHFPLYPSIPAKSIPLAFILLKNNQSSVTEADIEDARVLFSISQGCTSLPCLGG